MKSVIELHFMPMLAIFAELIKYDEVLLEACENYQKGSFRNKTYIAGPRNLNLITVPLSKGKHKRSLIRKTKIFYDTDWVTEHLRTIKTAYGSSPFFEYYFPEIEEIFREKHTFLWDLNIALLDYLNYRSGNLLKYSLTEEYIQDYSQEGIHDLREHFSPKQGGNSTPIPATFSYGQVNADKYGFRGDISVLDLLFHRGPESQWKLEELAQLLRENG